jgi:hypothetical protein
MMATGARDIHIHLTAQPGTTVHVTISGEFITITSDDAQANGSIPRAGASHDDPLEAAIQRLEGSGASPNIRMAIDGLRGLGYTLKLPETKPGKRPENYLRIMDPKYTVHGIGYLTPSNFSFSRMSDRERLANLTGVTMLTAAVNFSHVKSAQAGLDAARLLKS